MNDGGLMRLRPNAGQKREREIESDVGRGREGGEVEVMVAARSGSAARLVGRRAACRGREGG